MTEEMNNCLKCSRKIMPSISNRCLYCGADLPEAHHLSREEKNRVLLEKMEQFKENEENAEHIVDSLRQDYGVTDKVSKKQKKQAKAQAVSDALAEINDHLSEYQQKNNSE